MQHLDLSGGDFRVFFAPQGRHAALMGVKFHPHQCRDGVVPRNEIIVFGILCPTLHRQVKFGMEDWISTPPHFTPLVRCFGG